MCPYMLCVHDDNDNDENDNNDNDNDDNDNNDNNNDDNNNNDQRRNWPTAREGLQFLLLSLFLLSLASEVKITKANC